MIDHPGFRAAGEARGFEFLIMWHIKTSEDNASVCCSQPGQSFGTEEGHVHGLEYPRITYNVNIAFGSRLQVLGSNNNNSCMYAAGRGRP